MSAICKQSTVISTITANQTNNETTTTENGSYESYAKTSIYASENGDTGNFVNAVDSISIALAGKVNALQLNELAIKQHEELQQIHQTTGGEGSDSGVEINAKISNETEEIRIACGYASSSNGGMDESSAQCVNNSCDSSLVSCGSDLFEAPPKRMVSAIGAALGKCATTGNYECCSENGSESSSNAGGGNQRTPVTARKSSSVKKKVAMFESPELLANEKAAAKRNIGESYSSEFIVCL